MPPKKTMLKEVDWTTLWQVLSFTTVGRARKCKTMPSATTAGKSGLLYPMKHRKQSNVENPDRPKHTQSAATGPYRNLRHHWQPIRWKKAAVKDHRGWILKADGHQPKPTVGHLARKKLVIAEGSSEGRCSAICA